MANPVCSPPLCHATALLFTIIVVSLALASTTPLRTNMVDVRVPPRTIPTTGHLPKDGSFPSALRTPRVATAANLDRRTHRQRPVQEAAAAPSWLWLSASISAAAVLMAVARIPLRGPSSLWTDLWPSRRTNSYPSQQCCVAMAAVGGEGESRWSIGHVSAHESGFHMMTKAEIPGVLPRDHLMEQLQKWCVMHFQEGGHSQLGVTIKVIPQPDSEGAVFSFLLEVPMPDGLPPLEVQVCLDDETFIVQRQQDGFAKEVAQVEDTGKASFEVRGRNLLLRRREGPLPDAMRPLLLSVIKLLLHGINNYYAFGSVFSTDAT
eukprot:GGOE01041424.1.p1 GENE.GGOE01041424.1~~GGOE01041424.1.p1  ORF type:complete len:320 (-),score=84.87 GGOE01041424.1:270-1229(-)